MLDRHHGHGKEQVGHCRPHKGRHRRAMGRPGHSGERDGEVRLVLLALIATGLRDGHLRLVRQANGQGVEVHATDPSHPVLLPPLADGLPDLKAAVRANARLMLAAPSRGRHRRRAGKNAAVRLTPISQR